MVNDRLAHYIGQAGPSRGPSAFIPTHCISLSTRQLCFYPLTSHACVKLQLHILHRDFFWQRWLFFGLHTQHNVACGAARLKAFDKQREALHERLRSWAAAPGARCYSSITSVRAPPLRRAQERDDAHQQRANDEVAQDRGRLELFPGLGFKSVPGCAGLPRRLQPIFDRDRVGDAPPAMEDKAAFSEEVLRLGLCVELVTEQFRPTQTLKLLERLDEGLELVAEFDRYGFVVERARSRDRGASRDRRAPSAATPVQMATVSTFRFPTYTLLKPRPARPTTSRTLQNI